MKLRWLLGIPLTAIGLVLIFTILRQTHVVLNENSRAAAGPASVMTWAQFNALKLGEPSSVIAHFIPAVSKDKNSSGDTVIESSDHLGYFWLEWDNRVMPGHSGSFEDNPPTGDFLTRKRYYPK